MANNGFFVPEIKAKDFLNMENILSRKKLLSSFTQIPNEVISSDLTDGSVRLYAYLLSKHDNWKIWNADIKKSLHIGSNSTLAKRWKELLDFGLIEREQIIDDKGLFSGGFKYEIFYEINRNTVIENTDELTSNRNTLIGNAESLAIPKKCTHSNTDSLNNTEKESNTDVVANKSQPPAIKEIPKSTLIFRQYEIGMRSAYRNQSMDIPRSAKINKLLNNMIERIGINASLQVALNYPMHKKAWYVKNMHKVDYMVQDCESLWTQLQTGTMMTDKQARMTDEEGQYQNSIAQYQQDPRGNEVFK